MMSRFYRLLSFVLLWPVTVLAWQPAPGQDEFVPIDSLPPSDQLPAAPLLMAAYAFVWVVLLVYLWSIWQRMRKVERELAALGRRVQARQP